MMRGIIFVVALAALAAPALSGAASPANDAAPPYGIRFKCPQQTISRVEQQTVIQANICPQRLLDPEDVMTQPRLVVDPRDWNIQTFHALHGGHGIPLPTGDPAPEAHARDNHLHQPHTNWQTVNGGNQWDDNRYFAPDSIAPRESSPLGPSRKVWGMDNAITVDVLGNLYVAASYAWKPASEPAYRYSVGLWKAHADHPINYYENYDVVPHKPSFHKVSQLEAIYESASDRIVVMWLETRAPATPDAGPASYMTAYVTAPSGEAGWTPLPSSSSVGPCRNLTRPVAYGGLVYFGCLPDAGYDYGNGTNAEFWQIHSLDPVALTTARVSGTPFSTSHAMLVDRAKTGHMILIGSGVSGNGEAVVKIAYGTLGAAWRDVEDYSREFHSFDVASVGPPPVLADAWITAAAYTKNTGYLHTLYMEKYETGPLQSPAQAALRPLYKSYAVVRPGSDFKGNFDDQVRYGELHARRSFSPTYTGGLSNAIFEDRHDDIVVWNNPARPRDERVFTVFGDYGYVRYAQVVEDYAIPAPPLPPIGTPPFPIPVEAGSSLASGAAVGAIVGLMLLRLLAAKKAVKTKVSA